MTEARVPVTVEDRLQTREQMLASLGSKVTQDDKDILTSWRMRSAGYKESRRDEMLLEAIAEARLAGVAAGREEASAAIREVRLAEAAYAEGKSGAVDRLDAALKALFAYEVSAIRERGEG